MASVAAPATAEAQITREQLAEWIKAHIQPKPSAPTAVSGAEVVTIPGKMNNETVKSKIHIIPSVVYRWSLQSSF